MWLFQDILSTWNVASVSEELNFKLYLILINLNNNMWIVATLLDNSDLELLEKCWKSRNKKNVSKRKQG